MCWSRVEAAKVGEVGRGEQYGLQRAVRGGP